jgi:hypothetical protein
MEDTERLSRGALAELINRLKERTAGPEEVHRLLGEFVASVSSVETPRPELLRCLAEVFATYLDGSHKTLDKAFLLVRNKRGNPGADAEKEVNIAVAILDMRLRDSELDHNAALDKAAAAFSCGTTKAEQAWKRQRVEAFNALRANRATQGNAFTREEWGRACKIARVPKARWVPPKRGK